MDPNLLGKLRQELVAILGEERVLWRRADLLPYTTDADVVAIRRGDDVKYFPDLVVVPETTLEVQEVVKLAAKHKIPLLPKGGGSNRTGMLLPTHGGIVVDTIKMNRIVEVSIPDLHVTVQPGITLKELDEQLKEHGLALNQEQGSYKVATVGGSISTAGFTRKHQKYGTISDRVMSLEVVLADGSVMRTGPKVLYTSTGYRLNQLFIGAEGTLGIITEATLRVEPLPEAKDVIMAFFDDFWAVLEAANRIIASGVTFVGCDAGETDDAESWGAPRGKNGVFKISLEGTKGEVEAEREFIIGIIRKLGGVLASEENTAKYHEKFTIYWCGTRAIAGYDYEEDLLPYVPFERTREFYDRVWNDIMPKYGICPSSADARYSMDVGRYSMVYSKFCIPPDEAGWENYRKAYREALELAVSLGGSVAACTGIGEKHREYLRLEYSDVALDVMRSIKRTLDPDNIMNPGKKLP